ncbi:SDR family oxidoreductase [Streptomyces sp. NPDC006235]|uniref:SDR family NAD(P)-dependent oxidoreductase n=1 Tax=Streptomyces sp. NPDC006235 TaxID=3156736 RepID=UPI0033BDBE0D
MRIDLSGRTALVTGSTSGLGRATAAALARAGARVVVNGRTEQRVERAVADLRAELPDAHITGVAADVSREADVGRLVASVPEADVLVNNAGVYTTIPLFDVPDEEWRRLFEVNVLAGVRLARHYVPRMAERGWGRVVFVSSESAVLPPTEMVHYGVSKTAQLAVSRGMAQEMAGTGVTVNAVLPGPACTEGIERYVAQRARESDSSFAEAERAVVAQVRPTSLVRRLIRPEEVADLIVYLASDRSSATTGGALRVDGGIAPGLVP